MKMKQLVIIFLLALGLSANAQQLVLFKGKVTSSANGEAIAGAKLKLSGVEQVVILSLIHI